jgi:tetratricopeptide (TPR) repeat protein
LRAILFKLGEIHVPEQEIASRLNAMADELIKLREEARRLEHGPTELVPFVRRAQELIRQGDLRGAETQLNLARRAARQFRARASEYEADILVQEARVKRLQLDFNSAAAKFEEAARLMEGFDERKKWDFLLSQAGSLAQKGQDFADNDALSQAIDIYKSALTEADGDRAEINWPTVVHRLGTALRVMGSRDGDLNRLEEASKLFRKALDRVPGPSSQRAAIQISLGDAIHELSRGDRGTERMEESLQLYRQALQEIEPDHSSGLWIRAMNNLGNAQSTLGLRTDNEVLMREGVATLKTLIDSMQSDRTSGAWDTAQSSLGIVLARLGDRNPAGGELDEAILAFRAALTERAPDRVPWAWALTQSNLGNTLRSLGHHRASPQLLLEAVDAINAALTIRTREKAPRDWATDIGNLGIALAILGEPLKQGEGGGKAYLERAVTALRAAMEVHKREVTPMWWARHQFNLGCALTALSDHDTPNERYVLEAIEAFKAAQTERTREGAPHMWERTQEQLEIAEQKLASLRR